MPTPSLTARSLSMAASGPPAYPLAPPPCSGEASTLGASGDPPGSPLNIHEQSWHSHQALLSEDIFQESPTPSTFSLSDSCPNDDKQSPPKVTGYGPQAQAALVEALLEAGEKKVAAKVDKCGARPIPLAEYVEVVSRGHRKRHMSGLCHCGRFQLCPCCTPYQMAKRLDALTALAEQLAADSELRFFMAVTSVRHRFGARWRTLVDALREMMDALRQGHTWREVGVGYIRLLETTFGKNGHHPHEHLLLTLRVPPEWDPKPFFEWIQSLCERQAEKAGRTCAFQPGWWSEVHRDKLVQSIQYFGASDKMGTHAGSALMEFSTSTKHTPTWCIPAKAYAEVYLASCRLRWFGVGGVWKNKQTDKTDEELERERVSEGERIAHIWSRIYRSWSPWERRLRRAVIHDRALTDQQVVEYVVTTCGGGVGPAPETVPAPKWGDQND